MELELRFSDEGFTAWDGLGLMKRMLDHIEFGTVRKACRLPGPNSNHDYAPEQLVQQFMLSVWRLTGDGGCTQHGDGDQ